MGLSFEGREYSKEEIINLPINELIKICKAYNLTYAEFGPFLYKNRHVLWLKLEEKLEGQNQVEEELPFYNSIIKEEDLEESTAEDSEETIKEDVENIEVPEIAEKEIQEEEAKAEGAIDLSSWMNILEVSKDSDDNTEEEKEQDEVEFKYSYPELQVLDYITLANLCVDAGLIASEEDDDYYSYTKFELIAMLNNKYQLYTNLESVEDDSEEEEEVEEELKVEAIKAVSLSEMENAVKEDSREVVENQAEAEESEAEKIEEIDSKVEVEINETETEAEVEKYETEVEAKVEETEVEKDDTEAEVEVEEVKVEVEEGEREVKAEEEMEETESEIAEVEAEIEGEVETHGAETEVEAELEEGKKKVENSINEEEEIQTQPYKMIKYMPDNKENKFLVVEAVIGDKPIYRQPTKLEIEEIFQAISLYRSCNK